MDCSYIIRGWSLICKPACRYTKYTRHTSSYLGVAFANSAESHSLSMLTDRIYSAPTGNSNYLGYIQEDDFCAGLELLKSCFHFTVSNEQYDKFKTHFSSEAHYSVFADDKSNIRLNIQQFVFLNGAEQYSAGYISRAFSYPEVGYQESINPLLIGVFIPAMIQVAWMLLS